MSDQYTAAAAAAPSITQKLADLKGLLSSQRTVLLVTHAPNGQLHSRVMAPAQISPDWKFYFIYDRDSYKNIEVQNDVHVNLSVDGMVTNKGWASIAGKAKQNVDPELFQKLYNPTIKAWFADKGDGVHDGSITDPRIAVLEVRVEEIRHYHQQRTAIGTVIDVVTSAIQGATATPGEIREITGAEIAEAWEKGELKEE
ncbi:hypothetical protein L202_07924 [Cryptococcus amylolentus CBS 6039]|uniref:General stress protein FMN-binding split barrel domain-containing protein n=2 Tax=Cryptococcus amylolentus TaxID=104669 RepID=A0A1E3HCA0_9TREE|nr:hypothetical protein L202_07924 [Cryptococcus amylolentus CBS 6039]ODN73396.1 hypothetical protein L202_07924 [Cryptococcus amylolentus CBS 6039]ODN99171.1 hypothetical protein I350_07330 [Cryptococcus amylolentus CBS 6273]